MTYSIRKHLGSTDFDLRALKKSWFRKPLGLVHCGAHLAQEASEYSKLGFSPILWIEASAEFAQRSTEAIQKFPDQKVIQAALWNVSGVSLNLKIASNGASSSFRDFAEHSRLFPDIKMIDVETVVTTTLDSILENESIAGLLILDLQGVELQALQGARKTISRFDFVLCEVSTREIYAEQNTWNEISNELRNAGFTLIDWSINSHFGYGNALYGRKKKFVKLTRLSRVTFTLLHALMHSVCYRFISGKTK